MDVSKIITLILALFLLSAACDFPNLPAEKVPNNKKIVEQTKMMIPGKDFTVTTGKMQRVFDSDTEKVYGLQGYPDLPISVFKNKNIWHWFFPGRANDTEANEKGWSFRFVGTDLSVMKPEPSSESGKAMPVLSNGPKGSFDNSYAGLGSVYYDTAANKLYAWYHAEDYEFPEEIIKKSDRVTYGVKENPYYVTIALAVSNDLGRTFTKLGPVLTARMTKKEIERSVLADPKNYSSVDMCNPAVIQKDEYFYMYYCDISTTGKSGLAVARLPIKDIGASVQPWKKYWNGSFSGSQFGGDFDVLFEGIFPSVIYNEYLKQFIVVYPRAEQEILLRSSADGLVWSEPLTIVSSESPAWNVYPKLISEPDNEKHGQQLWLYYGQTPDITKEGQKLVRRKVILQRQNSQ